MNSPLRVFAPGRINLIGEHTDYNFGYVMPAAVSAGILFEFRHTGHPWRVRIESLGNEPPMEADLRSLQHSDCSWHNYILGVLKELQEMGRDVMGFDCQIRSTLPIGAGMSSSAALECGMAYGLNTMFNLGLSSWDLIFLCQRAEHSFVGVQCGIMDQFSVVMSKESNAALLDCRSLEFRYVPLHLGSYRLVLLNSGVSHTLAESQYNLRREQVLSAVEIISRQDSQIKSLRDISREFLDAKKNELGAELYKRCTFVLEENQRVLEALKELQRGSIKNFGSLLYASHFGLRDLYEVTCDELDFLVEISQKIEGVLGARMIGGGFGGCTLNLVHESTVDGFIHQVSNAYEKKWRIPLQAISVETAEGVHLLE